MAVTQRRKMLPRPFYLATSTPPTSRPFNSSQIWSNLDTTTAQYLRRLPQSAKRYPRYSIRLRDTMLLGATIWPPNATNKSSILTRIASPHAVGWKKSTNSARHITTALTMKHAAACSGSQIARGSARSRTSNPPVVTRRAPPSVGTLLPDLRMSSIINSIKSS